MKKYNVFIGFNEVAGYYSNLIKGFERLGIFTTSVFINEDRYGYIEEKNKNAFFQKTLRILSNKYYGIRRRYIFPKLILFVIFFFIKLILFFWAIYNHNVFIFGFNQSFFDFKDLRILKLFRKKIIFVYHGSDCRPPYMNGVFFNNGITDDFNIAKLTKKIKKSVVVVENLADQIINLPSQAQFFERKFINWLAIGIPIDIEAVPKKENNSNGRLKIVHAPTRPKQKGSAEFRKAIDKFIALGYKIKYEEITDRQNKEVVSELIDCDIVLDELYSDTPVAGFGAEAAFFAKPVIVCGYYAEQYRSDLSGIDFPPSLYCEPDKMNENFEKLLTDVHYRRKCGLESKIFIRDKWSPQEVARRFLILFENNAPDSWYYEPGSLKYYKGWGLGEERLRIIVKHFFSRYGKDFFQLNHNPALLDGILKFGECID